MAKINGLLRAIVINNQDPEGIGRVQVQIPQAGKKPSWARVATLMAGSNRGTWFIPEIGDEVLVAFEEGDASQPYVLGALWGQTSPPPVVMDASNSKKVLRSRNGVKVTVDDQTGQESFIVETPGGQKITFKDGPGSIEIRDANGNSLKLEPSGISVNSSGKVTVQASQVEVAAGLVTVNSRMSKFNGTVQCDTLISKSVISENYTAGVGNVL